ncbi:GOLPH3/VPS74 family protein [Micromonospora fluostatini]|uniref:GOLPH3/VPS74 family protein n=1 Tax=Micromonospora sp. JCM 30529 TaxID=3421643 RepID=UPI003D16B4A8
MTNANDGSPVVRLADELFLIGHDDFTGKPLAAAGNFDTALAGAILAELVLDGRLSVDNGAVVPLDHQPRDEPLTDQVLSEILRRGSGHSARLWLAFLRDEMQIRERVGGRLAGAGWVRRVESRGLTLRSSVRWPGVNPNLVAAPRVRLAASLQQTYRPLDTPTATLAALIRAANLIKVLMLVDRAVPERITRSRQDLPAALQSLLAAVDAGASTTALPARR